jgi:hypothetical protein
MPQTTGAQIAVIGIDIGKNSFHVVGHDGRGAIVLRQKWSRNSCRIILYGDIVELRDIGAEHAGLPKPRFPTPISGHLAATKPGKNLRYAENCGDGVSLRPRSSSL